MSMWKFLVKNQSIEILEREVLADHQIQYVQFKFTFDGDWKRFHKVVQFSQCDEVYSIVLGVDSTNCYLPAELHAGAVKMSVFGYDTESDTTVRATTVPVTLNIRASGFEGDEPPIPPTPDLYTQLIKCIKNTEKGLDGKSAYEIAVEHGFIGTEEEWLASLHGKDGEVSDPYATNERLNEQILLVREAIAPLEHISHSHQNKDVLDSFTADMLSSLEDLQQFEDSTLFEIQSVKDSILNLQQDKHHHNNQAVLDKITDAMLAALDNNGQFEDWTKEQIHTLFEFVNNFSNTAHTHENKAVLDAITAEKMAALNGIENLKTQISSLSSELVVWKNKCSDDSACIETMQETIRAMQAEMNSLDGNKIQTVFTCGMGTLEKYGETVYTFYNDGYRNLTGFVQSYPNFCNADNDYALNFNQTDFSWAGEVYAMFLTPVNIDGHSSIILTYQSGATETGEIYLMEKISGRTYAELAQVVHEQITNGNAIKLNFQWLQSSDFISVLIDCTGIALRGYYLVIKGVSDNTHPKIKAVKVLGG